MMTGGNPGPKSQWNWRPFSRRERYRGASLASCDVAHLFNAANRNPNHPAEQIRSKIVPRGLAGRRLWGQHIRLDALETASLSCLPELAFEADMTAKLKVVEATVRILTPIAIGDAQVAGAHFPLLRSNSLGVVRSLRRIGATIDLINTHLHDHPESPLQNRRSYPRDLTLSYGDEITSRCPQRLR